MMSKKRRSGRTGPLLATARRKTLVQEEPVTASETDVDTHRRSRPVLLIDGGGVGNCIRSRDRSGTPRKVKPRTAIVPPLLETGRTVEAGPAVAYNKVVSGRIQTTAADGIERTSVVLNRRGVHVHYRLVAAGRVRLNSSTILCDNIACEVDDDLAGSTDCIHSVGPIVTDGTV